MERLVAECASLRASALERARMLLLEAFPCIGNVSGEALTLGHAFYASRAFLPYYTYPGLAPNTSAYTASSPSPGCLGERREGAKDLPQPPSGRSQMLRSVHASKNEWDACGAVFPGGACVGSRCCDEEPTRQTTAKMWAARADAQAQPSLAHTLSVRLAGVGCLAICMPAANAPLLFTAYHVSRSYSQSMRTIDTTYMSTTRVDDSLFPAAPRPSPMLSSAIHALVCAPLAPARAQPATPTS
ncbi:hypothetical protein C8R45DRAFT_1097578 [Mycena sanguinolenta]|nr:hypothetical protein C8R45DRAFT_1097578 [Mycena sanguinolenta]